MKQEAKGRKWILALLLALVLGLGSGVGVGVLSGGDPAAARTIGESLGTDAAQGQAAEMVTASDLAGSSTGSTAAAKDFPPRTTTKTVVVTTTVKAPPVAVGGTGSGGGTDSYGSQGMIPGGSGYMVICRDGTVSSSGGKQGACSWHGGVGG
ncbi:MAG: hypothetical protein WCI34_05145 [Actinomycetes bacterium]